MQISASSAANQDCDDIIYSSSDPQSASSPSSSSSSSLPCPACGQTFRRREHLRRHMDRHSGRRSHTCDICKISFSRRDTLKRHVGTHGTAALAAWTQNNARFSRDHYYRACEACAKAKQRCDGRRPAPCTNCTNRNRHCSYPPKPQDNSSKNNNQTSLVQQPAVAADDILPSNLSSPPQPFQPLTPQSCVPGQPQFELDFTWDTYAQFLIPFSSMPSFGPGTSAADLSFGDAGLAAAADHPADSPSAQDGFAGDACTQRGALEAGDVFMGQQDHHDLTLEEEDILIAENVPHVPPLTAETRAYMIHAIQEGLPQDDDTQELDASFPSLKHLDTYMQLYFEHFHPRMPLLHVPTFQASPETWELVLSIVCLGSRYSQAHHRQDHVLLLQRLAQKVLRRELRDIPSVNIVTFAQSHLLFQQNLWLSGEWSVIIEAQCYRNILVTLCRMLLSREGTLTNLQTSTEDVNLAWSQWIKIETKRRLVHFIYLFECIYATFLIIPPLLSTAELTIPVPAADSYWALSREQWHLHPPSPQPPASACALLAGIVHGDVAPVNLEPLTKSVILCSTSMQKTAERELMKAMGLESTVRTAGSGCPNPSPGTVSTISERAFDALSQDGCSHVLREWNTSSSLNDFALLSRVLVIISFTPLSLLFSYNKWQTTDTGQSNARSELSRLLSQNVHRARQCLYYAAQTLQSFRAVRPATIADILSVLVSVLFMVLYVDVIGQQNSNIAGRAAGVKTAGMDIIRLDQVIDADLLNDWLHVTCHKRPHVSGVGLLDSSGSRLRLYKEGSRILATGSSVSRMAKIISALLESEARGYPPVYQLGTCKAP
ncbi:hypothetical protein FLONG3_674 [Fusarium longipes]|uniref:Uncharacterized protein n=1 Tax=Fusarium longipes TaxID=694270 RepID=A0A395T9F6_9HYPO|nr:hypothetical protein FLONG3_674 [Fusarium longipes]